YRFERFPDLQASGFAGGYDLLGHHLKTTASEWRLSTSSTQKQTQRHAVLSGMPCVKPPSSWQHAARCTRRALQYLQVSFGQGNQFLKSTSGNSRRHSVF